jgi:PAS domain-containing protein
MYGKIQKLRFAAMALSMGLAAFSFFMGAIWISSVFDSVDRVRMNDAGREIQSRVTVMRQMLIAEMSAFQTNDFQIMLATKNKLTSDSSLRSLKLPSGFKSNDSELLNVPEAFDFYSLYSPQRQLHLTAKRDPQGKILVSQKTSLVEGLIPSESAVFDRALSEGQASGLIQVDGRPTIIGLKLVRRGTETLGFIASGRKLDPRRLAPSAAFAEQTFEVFVPDMRVGLPADVEEAKKSMVGDNVSVTKLVRRGQGTGYLRFDDIFEKTAFLLRYKWTDSAALGEKKALVGLFICVMVFGGLVHMTSSGALTWVVRRRKQIPGLAGLSDWEFKATVESFPGYAFALDHEHQYVGVSRSLAGVFGKEPSDFVAKKFGSVSGEQGFQAAEVFKQLALGQTWPAVAEISTEFQGLGKVHEFTGSAHLVPQKKIVFYLVRVSNKARAA